jgi:hypothetical protein
MLSAVPNVVLILSIELSHVQLRLQQRSHPRHV